MFFRGFSQFGVLSEVFLLAGFSIAHTCGVTLADPGAAEEHLLRAPEKSPRKR